MAGAQILYPPTEALKRYWGFETFRPLQREAVEAALAGRDALVVLPTGGGKSICYQLPSVCTDRLVVVISPLIALMDDQVAAAREAGLRAGALHSSAGGEQSRRVYGQLMRGELNLLYASPERLALSGLLANLAERLLLVAVDEAHCVSHWGHEFRPEYRQLGPLLEAVPRAARMALTATATPQVQADIAAQLRLREARVLVGYPDRPNLAYRAQPRENQLRQTLHVIRRHPGEGGIVYVQTRADADRLAQSLQGEGVQCKPYHAGLPAAFRAQVQDDFVNERLDVVAATIAFGMGIDRPNVRFVVHANTPRSVEHYQQESGRAGRDGLPAECLLLFSAADLVKHRSLATKDGDLPPERMKALETQLREIGRYASAPVCRHRMLAEHFGAAYPPPGAPFDPVRGCGNCDVCLRETEELGEDEAQLTAQKIVSAVYRVGSRFGIAYVAGVLTGRADERSARFGHDRLRVFGILKDAGERSVRAWIDQLLTQGFLEVAEETGFPILRITARGHALCKNEARARLGRPPDPPKRESKKKTRRGASAALGVHDESLFEKLRALRKLLAEKLRVPPYVIFHDTVLAELSSAKPTHVGQLPTFKGIGAAKQERYGEVFVKVIAGMDPERAVREFGT